MNSGTFAGPNAFRRATFMAAARYTGLKALSPLKKKIKKQQLPLDPCFVRHEDTPHIHPHSTSSSKDPTHSHTVYFAVDTPGVEATCQNLEGARERKNKTNKKKDIVFVIVLVYWNKPFSGSYLQVYPLIERSQTLCLNATQGHGGLCQYELNTFLNFPYASAEQPSLWNANV